MRAFKAVFIIVLLLALPWRSLMAQTTGDFQPFIGEFTGQVVYAGPAGLAKRDLEVSIRRERGGFSLIWTTISRRASGKLKRPNISLPSRPPSGLDFTPPPTGSTGSAPVFPSIR